MARNRLVLLAFSLLLMTACIFNSSAGTPGGGSGGTPTAGSVDFSALATSPQSVMLTWKAVDGATGYTLEFGWNGQDFYPLADLPSSLTQYEDFSAIPGSTESYRIQAVTASGPGAWLRADATTPAAAPNPITVQPTYDDLNPATATIGPAGGSLSLTDAGGVTYKLDLPKGALGADTEIRLVAVTGMDGWPLDGGRLAAVRIDPAGLQLAEVATLTITLKTPGSTDLHTVGFAFEPAGSEFHLETLSPAASGSSSLPMRVGHLAAPVRQAGWIISIPITELMAHGAGQGSTSEIANLARSNAPTDAGAAAEQQQAAAGAVQDDIGGLPYLHGQESSVHDAERRLEGEMGKIMDQVRAANDGESLGAAMKQFEKWNLDDHGLTSVEKSALTDPFWEAMAEKLKDLVDKLAKDCEKSSGNPPPSGIVPLENILQNTINPDRDSQWFVFQSKITTIYGEDILKQLSSQLEKGVCGPFKVIKPIGASGTICSLAHPFTITEVQLAGYQLTVEFFPQGLTSGLVRIHQTLAANHSTFYGTGPYEVVFYSRTEANIQVQWTGLYVQPGLTLPAAAQPPLHYDLGAISSAACP